MSVLMFEQQVAALLDVPVEEARALTDATLRTLAERIGADEARDLATRMPGELQPLLAKSRESAEPFPYEEFLDRVAADAEVDFFTAAQGAAAALRVMREVVGEATFTDAMARLPREFHELVTNVADQP